MSTPRQNDWFIKLLSDTFLNVFFNWTQTHRCVKNFKKKISVKYDKPDEMALL